MILALVLLSLSFDSQAKEPLKQIPCFNEVSDLQLTWETIKGWKTIANDVSDQTILQSGTDTFGVWIELIIAKKGNTLIRFAPEHTEIVSFNKKDCTRNVRIQPGPLAFIQKNEQSVTDADLNIWIKDLDSRSVTGLLYTWSPHMNLSYINLDEVIEVAKKLKLDLKVVLDPRASQKAAESVAKKYKIPDSYLKRARSVELDRREIYTHYPSYHLINGKGWINTPRLGYDSPKKLIEYIQEELKK
ncbi:MAG: hypothetical protein KA715_12600 [Xanthomonadaceae bacterium]|nr:hypothetical protein [Xanthomonadaceae bacterium]